MQRKCAPDLFMYMSVVIEMLSIFSNTLFFLSRSLRYLALRDLATVCRHCGIQPGHASSRNLTIPDLRKSPNVRPSSMIASRCCSLRRLMAFGVNLTRDLAAVALLSILNWHGCKQLVSPCFRAMCILKFPSQ